MVANLLPCNMRQYIWGCANDFTCSLCGLMEDQEHLFCCEQMKNILTFSVEGKINSFRLLKRKLNNSDMKFLIKLILEKWNWRSAFGILTNEIIEYLQFKNIPKKIIIQLGRKFICIGRDLWHERCTKNTIKFQKTSTNPIFGPTNQIKRKRDSEITDEIINEVFKRSDENLFG